MKPENRTCCQCGGDFIATDPRKTFCSNTCRNRAGTVRRQKFGSLECAHCQKPFKKRRESQIYCSRECTRRAQGVKPLKPRAKIPCRTCGKEFTPHRHDAKFCSPDCATKAEYAVRRAKNAAALKSIACEGCGQEFQQRRKDARYCSPECYSRNWKAAKKDSVPTAPVAPATSTKAHAETARLFGDGFFMGHLLEEVARIGKLPGIVASLEAELAKAIMDDAVWPVGRPGRIALTLALLKNPALQTGHWRQPHEQRRRPGIPLRPTGIAIRAGRVRS